MTLRKLWTRLITGDGLRKTRFPSMRDVRVDLAGFAHLPRALWSTFLAKAFGHYQSVPWLGYRAVAHLRRLLLPEWSVLEWGSGMSTRFLAKHCARVLSVESDPDWQARVAGLGLRNVECRLTGTSDYQTLPDVPDHTFDFALVDGIRRAECVETALRLVRPGGHVFLDNADAPDYLPARYRLAQAAAPDSERVFVDFHPFQVQVNESLLVRLPSAPRNDAPSRHA